MIIYKTTCLVNNKIYIGQSKHNNPNYYGSGRYFLSALRKYGKSNFIKEIIIENISDYELMNELEILCIYLYKSNVVGIGYNIDKGGSGNTEYQNKRISNSNIGRVVSDITKRLISEANKGRKPSDETRMKLSEMKMGNKNRLGKKHSDDDRIKISEGIKKYFSENKYAHEKSSKAAKNRIKDGKCLEGIDKMLTEEVRVKSIINSKKITCKEVEMVNINNGESIIFESVRKCADFFKIIGTSQIINCLKSGKIYKNEWELKYKKS